MDEKVKSNNASQEEFSEIVKRAFEKGSKENEITVNKLIEEIKTDLRNMMIS